MRRFRLAHGIALALLAATLLLTPANAGVSLASDVQKAVKHYNLFGWTGGYHLIDEELDWELTKIILSKGGLPTDENKDKLLHGRYGG